MRSALLEDGAPCTGEGDEWRTAGGWRRWPCFSLAAGCQTQPTNFGKSEDIVDPAAGSQANIGSLSAVIAQNPNDANAYNVRGTAYGRAGKLREAIADFDAALKINPGFYQAYANRALVQRKLGRDELALADYNKAIEINRATRSPMSAAATSIARTIASTRRSPISTRRSRSTPTIRVPSTIAG